MKGKENRMNLKSEKICVALVMAALILIFGYTTFASGEEEIGAAENIISEEIQAVDEELVEPELEQDEAQDVDEEMVESEPTDIQAENAEVAEPEQTEAQAATISGTVEDDYVLVSKQGVVYVITETEAGDVMGQYVGEEVIVKGIVTVVDEEKFISVTSFDFVEK
jgi:preprotein translocase subunit SecF